MPGKRATALIRERLRSAYELEATCYNPGFHMAQTYEDSAMTLSKMTDSSYALSIGVDPRAENPFAIALHTYAETFYRDGATMGERHSAGQYFLLCHAIELSMKAFLMARGMEENSVRQLGHDLSATFRLCVRQRLGGYHPETQNILTLLNEYHAKGAKLRYRPAYELPLIGDVIRIAGQLIKATEPELPPLAEPTLSAR
jgi:hypothetical protein